MQPVLVALTADPSLPQAAALDHYQGTPLLLRLTPSEAYPIIGADTLNLELRTSATDPAALPLALTALPSPTGPGPYDLLLTSAQLNQPLSDRPTVDYWLVIYTLLGDQLQVHATIRLHLRAHAASLLLPPPPAPAVALSVTQAALIYATLTSHTALAARVTALELVPPGSSAVTSVAGRQGAVTLSQADISGTALRSIVTSAPGLLSAAGGTFGTGAFYPVFDGSAPGSLGTVDPGDGFFIYLTAEEAHFPYLEAQATNYPLGATFTYGGAAAAAHRLALNLDLVTNTADASKPVSTAQQAALNLKANLASPTFAGTVTAPAFSGPLTGPVTGNASTATALATARAIALTGPVTASVTFDGSSNVTLATALDLSSPGPIGATTASTVRATNFTQTAGSNSFGNTTWQDGTVWSFTGSALANIQGLLGLGAFSVAVHRGLTLTGSFTFSTTDLGLPTFAYASGAAAIHRTALGLGTLATVSPPGTQDATTYLRGDGAWATNLAVTTETTTARPLTLADNNTYIRCTNTSPTTITIPLQATQPWPPAAMITFRRATLAGAITLVGVSGVTIAGNTASSIAAEGVFAIVRTGTNTWDFV